MATPRNDTAYSAVTLDIIGVLVVAILALLMAIASRLLGPQYPDLSISEGACFGQGCYQVQIDGSGNVSYIEGVAGRPGQTFLPTTKRSGKITPQQVQELVTAFERARVWGMKDEYVGGDLYRPAWMSIGLSITLNGRSKHISYLGPEYCAPGLPFPWDLLGPWDSQRPVGVPPPQAFCDLRDKIETTVNLRQLANSLSTPTPGPTARPAATSTAD